MEFSYEKLDVVRLARELIVKIYQITEKFPRSEIYGLTNQIRRASVSILLNLAEGSCRNTHKDFKNFVKIAIGSTMEVDCALKIAIDLNYINEKDYQDMEEGIRALYFKLIGLSKYLSK